MLSPETIAEQVMGYVIWASELIPTLKPAAKNTYDVAILPQGPHFYTWLLQAAGYLLLDGQKKKLLIISQQSDNPKTILTDTTIYGPIFWQTRETSMTTLSKINTAIGGKLSDKKHKKIAENLQFQIPFFRVITETEEVIHVGIGEMTPQTQIKKIVAWIKKNSNVYNVVLLTNIELPLSKKWTKGSENNQIMKYIQKTSESTPIITIFQKILEIQKKKLEIIAYVNPWDFGKNKSLSTRYVCAVA